MSRTTILLSAAILALTTAATAAPADQPPRTLTVTGTGIAKGAPDEASFSTGVVSQGATAGQALAANSRAMNTVMAALKRQGVADKDIQTSNLSLNPQYQPCKPGIACVQKIVGYQASNTVNVTVGLDKAGPVIDALVASGSNQVDGISFDIHDPKPLLAQARADAVKDAMDRGQTIAKAAGVSLGPILSIQEGGGQLPRPVFKAFNTMAMAAPPPIAGGEESMSASVSITWQIQ